MENTFETTSDQNNFEEYQDNMYMFYSAYTVLIVKRGMKIIINNNDKF